jgi:hypothetical protein
LTLQIPKLTCAKQYSPPALPFQWQPKRKSLLSRPHPNELANVNSAIFWGKFQAGNGFFLPDNTSSGPKIAAKMGNSGDSDRRLR